MARRNAAGPDPAGQQQWSRWKTRFRDQQRQRAAAADAARDTDAHRIQLLEDDVARLTLMCVTLMDVVVRKGLLAREELSAVANEIDALDGAADGRLDPAALRPPEATPAALPENPPPRSPDPRRPVRRRARG